MKFVQRYDRGPLLKSYRMDNGMMLAEGFAAKPGILEYINPDGTITRELIDVDELHKADSLGTLGRAPLTLEHPDVDVTPENVQELGVGDVDGEVVTETPESGGFVRVKMAIRRSDAIRAVQAGKSELSPGYLVRVDHTPGVHPEFGEYDAIQRDRRYNHLAIVDVARGGPTIRLRADSARTQYHRPTTQDGPTMDPNLIALLTLLGVSRFDNSDRAIEEGATAVRGLMTRADSADSTVTVLSKVRKALDGFRKAAKSIKLKKDSNLVKLAAFVARADQEEEEAEAEAQHDNLESIGEMLQMAMAAIEELRAEGERLEGENAAMEEQLDQHEAAAAEAQDKSDRADLMRLVKSRKIDGVTDEVATADLRLKVVRHVLPGTSDDAGVDFQRGVIGVELARLDSVEDANRRAWQGTAREDGDDKRADGGDDDKPTNTDDAQFARYDSHFKSAKGANA